MNRTIKKVLSIVMIIMMALTAVPMSAFAAKECLNYYDSHDYGAYVTTTPATCKTEGVATATCKRALCNATTTKSIPVDATNHTEFAMPAKDPTCTVSGNTAGVVCSACDVVIRGYEVIPAKGHDYKDVPAKAPTCTAKGNTAGKICKVEGCGATSGGYEVIPETGHDFLEIETVKPSCELETNGKKVKTCKVCAYKEDAVDVPWAHTFGSWSIIKEATCTEDGQAKRTCLVCADTETKVLTKLEHTLVDIAEKPATCTEAGNSAGKKCLVCTYREGGTAIAAKGHTEATEKGTAPTCTEKGTSDKVYCSVCNFVITASTELPATGHTMVADTAASVTPTCTTTGIKAEKCSVCGHKTTETLDAAHSVSTWTIVSHATCTTDGKRRGICTKCNTNVVEVIPKTGHKVTNELSWTIKTQATCTKDGAYEAQCENCHQMITKPIPKTNHKEQVIPGRAATCKDYGLTDGKWCEYCGEETVKQQVIPLGDHTPGEWTVNPAPTCALDGKKTTKCTICGKDMEEVVAKLEHTKVTIPAKAATCTEPGNLEGEECSVCHAILKEAEVIEAKGHAWVDQGGSVAVTCTTDGVDNYKCSVCGEEKKGTVPATGHKNTETVTGTPATCKQPGLSDGVKCNDCGIWTQPQTSIPVLEHNWILDSTKSVAATCEAEGKNVFNCGLCGDTKEEAVAMLEHAWSAWETITEASCEAEGEKQRKCANCNLVDKAVIEGGGGCTIVPMEEIPATCDKPGSTGGKYCSKCLKVYEPATEIPATDHIFVDTIIEATISAGGQVDSVCELCGEKVSEAIDKIASIELSESKFTYTGEEIEPEIIITDAADELLVEGQDYECEYSEEEIILPGEYKVKVTFKGYYKGTKTLTFTVGAGKTELIETIATQKGTTKLEWEEVEGATGYRVYVYKSTGSKTRKRVASVEGTSYTLTKDYSGKALKMGKDYKIAIVAYTKLEDGTVIHAQAGVAKTFTQTPGKATLKAKVSGKKVTLTWTNLVNEDGYTIFYSTSKNGTYKKFAGTEADAVKLTKSLKAGTYYFKVRGYAKVDGETFRGLESSAVKVVIK